MDTSKLNLTSLKDKISSKLSNQKQPKGKTQKEKSKAKSANKSKSEENKESTIPKQDKNDESAVSEEEILRREALALGATEEDLALLKGVKEGEESEEEFEADSRSLDKSFNSDLASFMQGIGLGKGEVPTIDDDEQEEEEEEEEEDDDEADDDVPTLVEDNEEPKDESDSEDSDSDNSSTEGSDSDEDVKVAELDKKEFKKPDSDKITNLSSVDSSKLSIPGRTDWYNVEHDPVQEPEKLDRFGVERLYDRAKDIVEKENKLYLTEFTSNNSQKKFLSQILSDGTLNDKISALTLLIQEAPLHNLKAFDTLLGFCEKKSRTAALQAINALKDLLLNGVLPDRKLIAFNKQALKRELTDTHLALYFFEDYLKKAYFKLISILEVLSHDPIQHVRVNVLNHIFDLLKAKPEQEANLLRLGVNKLGDIDNKVSSKASYLVLQLEQAHPAMKKIVTDAVVDIIFQAKSDYHAKYYAILALNQTILTRSEVELANTLIKTYFALFEKTLVDSDSFNKETGDQDKEIGKSEKGRKNNRKNFKKGKKGGMSVKPQEKTENEIIEEKNTRLFSALLTGLNRAFPFSQLPSETYQKHLDTLFKITHSTNFTTSVQALSLIHHIVSEQKLNNDRYYRTLYESLLDPRLVSSSKQGIYLNLLFKSLKNDTANVPRVLAFVKRILQICCHWINVGAISGMLFLLMELSKTYPQIQELMVDPASRPDIIEGHVETNDTQNKNDEYDSLKRDPRFANAEKSSLWELNQFLTHYHPTVAIYASSLLEGTSQPKPDLGLFTLAHFLDRFVYKNSKQTPIAKGTSIMQPLGGAHTGSLLVRATNVSNKDVPVNTQNWLDRKLEDVQPDEKFFHQYFTTKISKIRNKKADEKKKDEDEDDEEGMEEDDVWQALVKSRPEVEEDSDEDLGFSDLDGADFSDLSDEEVMAEEQKDDEISEGEVEDEEKSDDDEEEDSEEQPEAKRAPFEDEDDFDENEIQMFGVNDEDEFDSDDMPEALGSFEQEADSLSGSEQEVESEKKKSKKRSRKEDKDDKGKKSKRSKLKGLPVFASTEDYAQYLDSEDEDYS